VELDAGRQPDGDHLGDRAFRAGHIVSTASIAGLISGSSNAYNVSKYGVVALSEGLRRELAPRGIGVSMLCPGFIRTQIMNSRRNLLRRFAEGFQPMPTAGPLAEMAKMIRERVSQGIDPLYVGELVREGIEQDLPYIFTDTDGRSALRRHQAGLRPHPRAHPETVRAGQPARQVVRFIADPHQTPAGSGAGLPSAPGNHRQVRVAFAPSPPIKGHWLSAIRREFIRRRSWHQTHRFPGLTASFERGWRR